MCHLYIFGEAALWKVIAFSCTVDFILYVFGCVGFAISRAFALLVAVNVYIKKVVDLRLLFLLLLLS